MADKRCIDCNTVLSPRNRGILCFTCQEKRLEERKKKMGDSPNYDVNDMCFILDLSPEQVRRLGRDGILPGRIPGIKQHLYLRESVDRWIRSNGELTKPGEAAHHSELALTTLKLVEILDYYYQAHRTDIVPTISTDFPYMTYVPGLPTLEEGEFSNLMHHLKGEIPELASIAEYPSECKRYFAARSKLGDGMPTATITGDVILKLKLFAGLGNFPGKCPDCPR